MISLSIFSIVTMALIVFLRDKLDTTKVIYAFFVSLVTGVVLDYTLGAYVGLWTYTHLPYFTIGYFSVIPLGWGMFGIFTLAILEAFQGTSPIVTLTIRTAFIAIINEVLGYLRNIWIYNAPLILIIIGWFMLVMWIEYWTNLLYNFAKENKYAVREKSNS